VFGWYHRDFNYDGAINIDDYGSWIPTSATRGAPFGTAAGGGAAAVAVLGVAAVPERANVAALGLGAVSLFGRRRRPLA
jgi:acyl CoA:acetate/3-ketoacid CoA transferase beta subunit